MNPNNIDPKLKLAREEIDKVLQKYDINAAVVLGSRTHMEFWFHNAQWSCGSFKEGELRVRTHGRERKDKDDTLSYYINLADILGQWSIGLLEMSEGFRTQLEIIHKPFGGPGGFTQDE